MNRRGFLHLLGAASGALLLEPATLWTPPPAVDPLLLGTAATSDPWLLLNRHLLLEIRTALDLPEVAHGFVVGTPMPPMQLAAGVHQFGVDLSLTPEDLATIDPEDLRRGYAVPAAACMARYLRQHHVRQFGQLPLAWVPSDLRSAVTNDLRYGLSVRGIQGAYYDVLADQVRHITRFDVIGKAA